MTIRTACSSSLVGLNEACAAIAKGDCTSAIVGGTSIMMVPSLTTDVSEHGALSPDGSCKTFSSEADGYARGEAIVAVYLKPLCQALQDGSPVRAVIVGTATNSDGKTPGFSYPNPTAQESLIRHTYNIAGISETDVGKTGFFECHGTGTPIGDVVETEAVARVFGKTGGIYIGSIKPNLGHGEGASGLTAVLKAVLALNNRIIPPNIKCSPLNEKIPFAEARLIVPTEPTKWPEGRLERISINSFGIGGSNAHVIIDSAKSFGISTSPEIKPETPELPQLLVYSAKNSYSLKILAKRYSAFVESIPDTTIALADVAYTLATRREHFNVRSFAVGTRDKLDTTSSPISVEKGHCVVLAFTGQGAQWPQMGRELLRSNPVFRRTIISLDDHLQDLHSVAPNWTIQDELEKPSSRSRINEAEFSQPICTALQIALVDTLVSAGIKPSAVVGHSSGEIAAAYSAGALTAREAIIVAFLRGLTTGRRSKPGTMAAVGASREEVTKHLIPGVVVACHNSPKNVTLSGDAASLDEVLVSLRKSLPGIIINTLKVNIAYHSPHMVEIGHEYERIMEEFKVEGKRATVPFFSSVIGGQPTESEARDNFYGPSYWRRNLECPVLFNEAICSIVGSSDITLKNPIFLELGPHATLSGILKQTLAHESSTSPYIATIIRRQNSLESFLSAIGKLWAYHVNVDFKSLMPSRLCLPDLPRYPWNQQEHYWKESRVSKEWRFCAQPYHDLLGAKLPESSSIEPVFRNIFHIQNVPWIRDHRIKDAMVFPFACYLAMGAEAICQVTSVRKGVEFRCVTATTALVLNEEEPVELITSLRRQRLTTKLDSDWWEFTVLSHNRHHWIKHCYGEVRATSQPLNINIPKDTLMPHRVDMRQWYGRVIRGGLEYGPSFAKLDEMTTLARGAKGLARAKVKNNGYKDANEYHLHPTTVDNCFQAMSAAAHHGFTHDYRQFVPSRVDYMAIYLCSSDVTIVYGHGTLQGNGIIGEASCVADSGTVLRAFGVHLSPLDAENDIKGGNPHFPSTARCQWVPHMDFENLKTLIRPVRDHKAYMSSLETLGQLAIVLSQRSLSKIRTAVTKPHLQNYRNWLDQQSFPELQNMDTADLKRRMDSLFASLAKSPAAAAADSIIKTSSHIQSIISGEKGVWETLDTQDTISKLDKFLINYDTSRFFRCLGHNTPNLRILELGASVGHATDGILKHLVSKDGQVLYSQYVCSDASSGLIAAAQEHLQGVPNLEFATLDISKDPSDQGFKGRQFDLIIAMGIVRATHDVPVSLKNARKLLSPGGRLLLQQPRTESPWLNYVLGLFPSWRCGVEQSNHKPSDNSRYSCEGQFIDAGFTELEEVVLDSQEHFHLSSIAVAKVGNSGSTSPLVTVLHGSNVNDQASIIKVLETSGFHLSHRILGEDLPAGQDVISLLDMDSPFFAGIDSTSLESFKTILGNLSSSDCGLFWVTKPSQTRCKDARYAMAIGLARTIRSEMGIDFATCQVDNIDTLVAATAVAKVFRKFHQRETGAAFGSDFEYSISDNSTCVSRILPFSLDDKDLHLASFDKAVLGIGQEGQLDTLRWVVEPAVSPIGDEVEVEVHSVGLNFRVSNVMCLCFMLVHELTKNYLGFPCSHRAYPSSKSQTQLWLRRSGCC